MKAGLKKARNKGVFQAPLPIREIIYKQTAKVASMSHSIRKSIFLRNNPRTTFEIRKMRFKLIIKLSSNQVSRQS